MWLETRKAPPYLSLAAAKQEEKKKKNLYLLPPPPPPNSFYFCQTPSGKWCRSSNLQVKRCARTAIEAPCINPAGLSTEQSNSVSVYLQDRNTLSPSVPKNRRGNRTHLRFLNKKNPQQWNFWFCPVLELFTAPENKVVFTESN